MGKGKLVEDLEWALWSLIRLEKERDRRRIREVCEILKGVKYLRNPETVCVEKQLIFHIGGSKKVSPYKRAATRFLKYVDVAFLEDFLRGSPRGTFGRMVLSLPKKEMERIVARIDDKMFASKLAEAFSDSEMEAFSKLRKTG